MDGLHSITKCVKSVKHFVRRGSRQIDAVYARQCTLSDSFDSSQTVSYAIVRSVH